VPSFLGFLVDAGLVLVLLLFMLIAYKDLRDRLFRLVGYGRVTVTTKALEEGPNIEKVSYAATCIPIEP
jgi:predicted PurR-regulated permease PerM